MKRSKKKNYIFNLKPGYKALIKLDISPNVETSKKGVLEIKTQYHTLRIPYYYICSHGEITFSTNLNFGEIFPGKILKRHVYAYSTFNHEIKLTKMTTNDKKFIPIVSNRILQPKQKTKIGYILFDSSLSGTKYYKKKKKEKITENDIKKFQKRSTIFKKGNNEINIDSILFIHTNILKKYMIDIRAKLIKPKISVSKIDFALVHLGTAAIHFIRITNPSPNPLKVKLILGKNFSFSHSDHFLINEPSKGIVPPNQFIDLGPLVFAPTSKNTSTSEIYVKNNLTLFEIIKVKGEGGIGRIVFKQDGKIEDKIIFWNFHESDFGFFKNNEFVINVQRDEEGFITLKKTFNLQNIGNLPVNIQKISLDQYGCSSYGVTLETCEPIMINPNEEKPFIMRYKPDFTTSKTNMYLIIETRTNIYRFPIVVSLPHSLLYHLYGSQPLTITQGFVRFILTLIIFGVAVYIGLKLYNEVKWINDEKIPTILLSDLQTPQVISQKEIPQKESPTSPKKYSSNYNNSTKKKKPKKKKKEVVEKIEQQIEKVLVEQNFEENKDEEIQESQNKESLKEEPQKEETQKEETQKEEPQKEEPQKEEPQKESTKTSPIKEASPKENSREIKSQEIPLETPSKEASKKHQNEPPKDINVDKIEKDFDKKESSKKESQKEIINKPEKNLEQNEFLKTPKEHVIKTDKVEKKIKETIYIDNQNIEIEIIKPIPKRKEVKTETPGVKSSPKEFNSLHIFNENETSVTPVYKKYEHFRSVSPSNFVISRLTQALKPKSNNYFSLFTDPSPRETDEEEDTEKYTIEESLEDNTSFFSFEKSENPDKNNDESFNSNFDDSNLPEFFKTK